MIYFTIIPTNSGFTDQMMQFNAFYKLGRALQFQYLHTTFCSSRSMSNHKHKAWYEKIVSINKPPMDVYEFLGFNLIFTEISVSRSNNENLQIIDLPIGRQDFLQKKNFSIHEIKNYINCHLAEFDIRSSQILIRFSLDAGRKFFTHIHTQIPELPDGLNLKTGFIKTKNYSLIPTNRNSKRLRMMVHIRQGDTAVVNTPWHTFVPVDKRRAGWLREHHDLKEIESANIDIDPFFTIDEYYQFIVKFLSYFDHSSISFRLFSDGFERAFDILIENISNLALSADKEILLSNIIKNYNQSQFDPFKKLSCCKTFVGESDRNLKLLIQETLKADIIIIGYQQRMLPKFLANYRLNDMPMVIVLHKGKEPSYHDIAFGWDDKFIFIDIRSPNFKSIMERLNLSNHKLRRY